MTRTDFEMLPGAHASPATLALFFLALLTGSSASESSPQPTPAVTGARDAASTAAQPAVPDSTAALERGRRLTAWLLEGPADSVASTLAPAFRRKLGGAGAVGTFSRKLDRRLGAEERTVSEEVFTDRGLNHYYRVSRFSKLPGGPTVTTHWAWRDGGPVVAMKVSPTPRPAETGHGGYRTRAELRLPFDGRWYVGWGGRAPRRNYHVRARDQRFAYDFLKLRGGSSHTGDGSENADYHCWGTPVRAPAAGRVVRAADSVPDNAPGEMNRKQIFGNHVVLDHGGGEYSVLAHLRHGSVAVDVGDRVKGDQLLGECGNSGHSSEPHLHYHLQDGRALGDATGLPAQFRDYRADGESVDRGEPRRGQFVRPEGSGGTERW